MNLSPCRFDPENEGAIRTDELRFVMSNLPVKLTDKASHFTHVFKNNNNKHLNVNFQEVDEMMRAADTNSDGLITFDEFRRMMGR